MPSTVTYLLLDVAGLPCALPRAQIREILPLPHLHAAPAAGGTLAGFLNLGGTPVPVLDLARLLGLRADPGPRGEEEPDPYRHLVLAGDGALALMVDRVLDLVAVAPDAVRPLAPGRTFNGCVAAEITLADRLIHALDLARILTAEERARIDALARQAGERLAALAS